MDIIILFIMIVVASWTLRKIILKKAEQIKHLRPQSLQSLWVCSGSRAFTFVAPTPYTGLQADRHRTVRDHGRFGRCCQLSFAPTHFWKYDDTKRDLKFLEKMRSTIILDS